MHVKDAEGTANSVDPDQTAPGSALFAQICLSEKLETLRYQLNAVKQKSVSCD